MVAAIHPIDRASALPLWAQLLADVRRRLDTGEFARAFPTDVELAAQYGVSRQTVREALRRLVDERRIERLRGRGTRVRGFEHSTGSLESLYEHVRSRGASQRSVVLTSVALTDAQAARRLGLRARARLVFIERLRLADEQPLALDRAWLPARIAAPILALDLSDTGLYVELARSCGVEALSATERVRPVLPSRSDRRTLRLPQGEAAFQIERLTRSRDGLLEWRVTLVRGDRYSLTLDLAGSPGGAAALPWEDARASGR